MEFTTIMNGAVTLALITLAGLIYSVMSEAAYTVADRINESLETKIDDSFVYYKNGEVYVELF